MGKKDIFEFLSKNPDAFFSTKEIGNILEINFQSARSALNKLNNENLLQSKNITVNKFGPAVTYFAIKNTDDELLEAIQEYTKLRSDKEFATSNQSLILGLMQIKELKKIRRLLECKT